MKKLLRSIFCASQRSENIYTNSFIFLRSSASDKLDADRCRANDKLTVKNSRKGDAKGKNIGVKSYESALLSPGVFREDRAFVLGAGCVGHTRSRGLRRRPPSAARFGNHRCLTRSRLISVKDASCKRY